jgi:hypothetical protein
MASPKNTKPSLSPTEARQGVRGMPVLIVLISALVLAAIVWVGIEIWGHSIDPNKSQPTTAPTSPSTGSSPQRGTIDNTSPAGQSQQPAPTDRTEDNQHGINSTPAQPSRDGTQN